MITHTVRALAIALLFGMGLPAAAQTNDNDASSSPTDTITVLPRRVMPKKKRKPPREFDPHMVKLNVLSLVTKSVSLQYEYGFARRMSVALGVRFKLSGNIPFGGVIKDYLLDDATQKNPSAVSDFLDRAKVSGFAITPEFRYYVGPRPHRGFYIAPFARYAVQSLRWDYTFKEIRGSGSGTQIVDRYTDNEFKLTTYGAGLMIGSQFQFQKVLLDWWILGASYNQARLDITVKTDLSDRTDAENEKTEQSIEGVSVGKYKVDATINKDGGSVTGSGGAPLLRFGLCIGYRF